jgi:NADH dehydrogenase [ubiquinone] 1 alpha subcomplex assembly factor 7
MLFIVISLQAFRQHKLHEPLVEPGSADLTADVDFSYLKEMAGDKGKTKYFIWGRQDDTSKRFIVEFDLQLL